MTESSATTSTSAFVSRGHDVAPRSVQILERVVAMDQDHAARRFQVRPSVQSVLDEQFRPRPHVRQPQDIPDRSLAPPARKPR